MAVIFNPDTRVARVAQWATAVFAVGVFAPVNWFGMDGMRGGYALGFLSFFLAIVSAVTWLVFRRRARLLETFLAGTGILARWDVPPAMWAQFVAADLTEEKRDKKQLLKITVGWMVVIGAGFLLVDAKAGLWIVAVFLAVLAIVTPLALRGPDRRAAKLLCGPMPVVIGQEGAYVGGELHDWRLVGSYLAAAELDEQTSPKMLRITYYYLTGQGAPMPVEIRIPVPPGHEAEAARVQRAFSGISDGGPSIAST